MTSPDAPTVIYGLTGNPIHNGHVQSFEWLKSQGFNVVVSPAIGHEFKPEALANYPVRRHMAFRVFGFSMVTIEERVLDVPELTHDLNLIRAAIKRLGHPVMAIDMLRQVRLWQQCVIHPRVLGRSNDIRFAIGPDINVEIWTGIEEIRAEGFGFVRMPEIPNIRSTLIRANIAAGLPWEHMVPPEVAQIVKDYGLYGWRDPQT